MREISINAHETSNKFRLSFFSLHFPVTRPIPLGYCTRLLARTNLLHKITDALLKYSTP